jgi:hypothetical protein
MSTPEVEALRETLDALEMPRAQIEGWLLYLRRFCEAHGGAPRYAELLELISASLDQLTTTAGAAGAEER